MTQLMKVYDDNGDIVIVFPKPNDDTKKVISELMAKTIGENNFDLYGFYTKGEKRCFELLVSVSGIGPKAALSILSYSTPETLALAIMNDDVKALTVAPGVGKKIAQTLPVISFAAPAGDQAACRRTCHRAERHHERRDGGPGSAGLQQRRDRPSAEENRRHRHERGGNHQGRTEANGQIGALNEY